MKALKSHPHIERPRRINSQITLARYTAGLVLALVGLISAATLALEPAMGASAQAEAQSWTLTGSLNTPRYLHTATLLPDGKVLVAGGGNISGGPFQNLDSAELYDPATGKWNATGSLNTRRSLHTATLLEDGKVLIVGGNNISLNGAELYNPENERWSVTGSLNTPRTHHTATLLKSGKVLVVGGVAITDVFGPDEGLDTAELYDPNTGDWSFTGNLNTAVVGHTATLLQNGKVLVLGGFGSAVGAAELYDPDTGAWSSTGNLIHDRARTRHTATLLSDGKVLVTGGEGFVAGNVHLRSAELYDPDTGEWSSTGRLRRARIDHTATLLPDGKVLVASLTSSELYDPDTGAWSFAGHLNSRRERHTATLLPDGKPLLVGGIDLSTLSPLASVELGNSHAAVTPPKITMASVAGKNLIVVGENFNPDAVIMINGEEQKTRNDDQNPQTTLIGKKAGKKIRPGDRVQVRNPDGALSEVFIFTGS